MLDIKEIRENPELVRQRIETKNVKVDLEALLTIDDKRRTLSKETDICLGLRGGQTSSRQSNRE